MGVAGFGGGSRAADAGATSGALAVPGDAVIGLLRLSNPIPTRTERKATNNPKPKLNFALSALRSERTPSILASRLDRTSSILASSSERIKAISERRPSILASSSERIKTISERTPRNPRIEIALHGDVLAELLAKGPRDALRLFPLHAHFP